MTCEGWPRLKTKKLCAAEWILAGLLLMTLLLTARVNWQMAHHMLDSDASSEIMLSDLLFREKALYSEDWYYSTEFNIQNQLVYGFLFNFFDGWVNVRFFGTCILQGIYLLSFLYMMSRSGLSRKAVLVGGILAMLPYCVSYGRIVLYHCYYLPYFVPGVILTGLLFSVIGKPGAPRFMTVLRYVLIVLVSFLSSVLYVRQLFILMLPIAGCLFFFLLARTGENGTPYRKWMIVPVVMCAAGAAGTLFNAAVLIPGLDLYRQTEQNLTVADAGAWRSILQAAAVQFGFRTDVPIFSLPGVLSLGGLFSAAVLIFTSVRDLFRRDIPDFREFLLRTLLPVNLMLNVVIFIFGEVPFRSPEDYSRYMLSASVWIAPLLCCRLSEKLKLPDIRRVTVTVCTLFFVLNGIWNGLFFTDPVTFAQPYDGLVYNDPILADRLQTALEYIRAHDYDAGYAFLTEANVLVELMNGFPVVPLHRGRVGLEYSNWLSRRSYKTAEADKAFFLMTREDEATYAEIPAMSHAERVYFDDEGFVMYEITDLPAFREAISEP